jgi:hypothetical protein
VDVHTHQDCPEISVLTWRRGNAHSPIPSSSTTISPLHSTRCDQVTTASLQIFSRHAYRRRNILRFHSLVAHARQQHWSLATGYYNMYGTVLCRRLATNSPDGMLMYLRLVNHPRHAIRTAKDLAHMASPYLHLAPDPALGRGKGPRPLFVTR